MLSPTTSITQLISEIADRLDAIYTNTALSTQYAWWIVESITGRSKSSLLIDSDITLTHEQFTHINQWLTELIEHKKPIQYLIGNVPFNNVEILVEAPILIPRQETEEWCTDLIEQLKPFYNQKLKILDMCCGSGCIAISLAKALPNATVYALDIDNAAIALTQKNIAHNNITNVVCMQSDLFESLAPNTLFDLIVTNPPYIAADELPTLDDSVKNWEAHHALIAPDNGLALIKKIIMQAPLYLKPHPLTAGYNLPQLIIEIGYRQGAAVVDLLAQAHYNTIHVRKDLEGNDRTVRARKN